MLGDLDQFRGGTNEYMAYQSPFFPKIHLTDGARHVMEHGGQGDNTAWWLVDAILSHQRSRKLFGCEFQVWKLTVKNGKGTLTCEDGDKNVIITQRIPYTDFDPQGVVLWFENNVLYLPCEH